VTGPVLPVLPVTAGQARLQRGGRVTLVTRREFPSTVVPAAGPGRWLAFPGTEDLAGLLAASGANAIQVGFTVTPGAGSPGGGVLVHLDPAGPAPVLAGAVAFLARCGGKAVAFRLPLAAPVRSPGRVGAGPVTVAFLGVGPAAPEVSATLLLVLSTVERLP